MPQYVPCSIALAYDEPNAVNFTVEYGPKAITSTLASADVRYGQPSIAPAARSVGRIGTGSIQRFESETPPWDATRARCAQSSSPS
jgi:hypothetical protein